MADPCPSFDENKMKHVILYFVEHINNFHLGKTKLMKLLYYVDFDACEKLGVPVTGAKYRKLLHGPVPDEAEVVIRKMEREGEVEQIKSAKSIDGKIDKKFVQHRLVSKNAKFDASVFSGAELEIIERVAKFWEDATAKELENASHKEAPWAATEDGKTIDYEMAHYRSPKGDNEEIDSLLVQSRGFEKFISTLQ